MTEELRPISYPGFMNALRYLSDGSWPFDPSPLAGRNLVSVEARDDGKHLVFIFADGEVVYSAEGDCCSHSWIEHLTVPPDVAGAQITAWAEQEMGEKADEYETIRVYQTSFRTDKGDIVVEYRNASNGYYGGWLEGPRT